MAIDIGWKIEYTRNNYPQTFEVVIFDKGFPYDMSAANAEHALFEMMEKRGITIRDILSTSRV